MKARLRARPLSKPELSRLNALIPMAVEHADGVSSQASTVDEERCLFAWSVAFHERMDELAHSVGLRSPLWLAVRARSEERALSPVPGLEVS